MTKTTRTQATRQIVLSTLITLGALVIGVIAYFVLYASLVDCELAVVAGQGLTNLCDADQAAMVSMLAIVVALAVTWLASFFSLLHHGKEVEKEVAVRQQVAPPPPPTQRAAPPPPSTGAATPRDTEASEPSASPAPRASYRDMLGNDDE